MRTANDVGVTSTKSSMTDIVTNADGAAEDFLRSTLLKDRPGDAWLGEETGVSGGVPSKGQVRWIVDPIDGTVNYLYGLPGWAVSIAAEVDGVVVAGAVVVPTLREEFSASLGDGATRNGEALATTTCSVLGQSLIATGFSYDPEVRGRQGNITAKLLPRVRDIRRAGAASVDFCAVAAGRVDAYFEWALQPWDRAAGALIAREAGAVVNENEAGDVVVAGAGLIDKLEEILTQIGDGE